MREAALIQAAGAEAEDKVDPGREGQRHNLGLDQENPQ